MNDDRRVLVADEDPAAVWVLGRHLTREGFALNVCSDGGEALELLQQQRFGALIADVQLPGVNGLALLDWVRAERPDTLAVITTAFGSQSIRAAALSKGASLFAEKPVDPDLIVQVLKSPSSAQSFSGTISEINLFDYIQLMLVTNRQVVIDVWSSDARRGRLFIKGGEVPHAICGSLSGESAFYECCGFDGGSFTTRPWSEPERVTIEKRGEFLLMEAARKKDESGRSELPAPTMTPPEDVFGEEFDNAFDLAAPALPREAKE